MKFNNRPNECITLENGQEVWLARSVAVAFTVIAFHNNTPYVLINQRGTGVPNFQGYWNLPCGYLDYDETVQEAAVREVWEECGVNVLPLLESSAVRYFDQPWHINSTPNGTKQNITIHHGLLTAVTALPDLSNANNEPNETLDITWLPLSQIHTLEFAFDHKERIEHFVQQLESRLKKPLVDITHKDLSGI